MHGWSAFGVAGDAMLDEVAITIGGEITRQGTTRRGWEGMLPPLTSSLYKT